MIQYIIYLFPFSFILFFRVSGGEAGIPVKLLYEAEGMKVTVEVRAPSSLYISIVVLYFFYITLMLFKINLIMWFCRMFLLKNDVLETVDCILSLDEKWRNLSWDVNYR